jgi:hypothetical protein
MLQMSGSRWAAQNNGDARTSTGDGNRFTPYWRPAEAEGATAQNSHSGQLPGRLEAGRVQHQHGNPQ